LIKTQRRQLNVFFYLYGKELPDFTTVKDKVAVALKKLFDKTNEKHFFAFLAFLLLH
jgi:hypothetical protein